MAIAIDVQTITPVVMMSKDLDPKVNADIENLTATLNSLIQGVQGLASTVGSLAGGSSGSPSSPVTDGGSDGGGSTGTDFDPVAETSVLLVDESTRPATSTWESISAGAPANARWAKIQFRIKTNADSDVAGLYYRDADGAEVLTVDCDDDQNDGQPVYWDFVKLDSSGNFEYNMLVTGTEPDWQILRVGYVM